MEAKKTGDSRTILTDIVLPPDTNYHGTIFGGNVMAYMDKVATIAAMRHCRKAVVTASSDSLDFLAPIRTGEAVCVEAYVSWTHHTSMEVYVNVQAENLLTGERRLTSRAYLTFVALDENDRPVEVPAIIPESEEEKWNYNTATTRYENRKRRRQAMKENLNR